MPFASIAGPPGSVAKTIPARVPLGVTFMIRGRFSSERYINNRCRSIWVDSARNSPRCSTRPSIGRFRIPAKYSSGSVDVRTALEGIPYLREPSSRRIIIQYYDDTLIRINSQQKFRRCYPVARTRSAHDIRRFSPIRRLGVAVSELLMRLGRALGSSQI